MAKPFASSADTAPKAETLEVLADGVYAFTSEGDPNVGAIEGEDHVVCFDARATPVAAADWLTALREHTDKPVRHLVLSHYHAVRTLGASAFGAAEIIMHAETRALIGERGEQDWASEHARMPRLFKEPGSIPGLTWPTITFSAQISLALGGDRGDLVLGHAGRGHTKGDVYAWLPDRKILFAGDLVESEAALYTGDAYHKDWLRTLDGIAALGAEVLVGGRGAVVHGAENVEAAIEQTKCFLLTLIAAVEPVHAAGGDVRTAFDAAHQALEPTYGKWPIFEHCLPFDVQRFWDELDGIVDPRIWTPERDREVWALLQDRG
ncbi:MBL fold metallo-hydrolase [Allokutzneria albata]|uniref:Glyoxylase, beta-lactamase superfamily II n=1 Tax=Allokutzneria albata TaxID=211114 RepID=A0A1G9YXB2_ALLAB|nr:MBL fold metallo-hydrolase [Allokutzneria albata]SDN13063.1 Glyoxylase, beta-lactamase superfamily II [Allokutzneria albata]